MQYIQLALQNHQVKNHKNIYKNVQASGKSLDRVKHKGMDSLDTQMSSPNITNHNSTVLVL